MNKLNLKLGSLTILSGLPGSGKSALKDLAVNLPPGAWLSSDAIRELVYGVTKDLGPSGNLIARRSEKPNSLVFEFLREAVKLRLADRLTTVVDATNITEADRRAWVAIAEEAGVPYQVVILDTPLEECISRNKLRAHYVPEAAIREMANPTVPQLSPKVLARSPNGKQEVTAPQGFSLTSTFPHFVVSSSTVLNFCVADVGPMDNFDVIGDVHGLLGDLLELLKSAGWQYADGVLTHPEGRRLLFLGDLVDRGPHSLELVELVMRCVKAGTALAIKGNHELKLLRFYAQAKSSGISLWSSYSNAETGMRLLKMPEARASAIVQFLKELPTCYVHEDSKSAFVHGDLTLFDPLSTPAELMLFGESRNTEVKDTDKAYQDRYDIGLNNYTLFRGHVTQRSVQKSVFSLERHAFQHGELVLMRLDEFNRRVKAGESTVEAFNASLLTKKCDFDYDAYADKTFSLSKGLERLVSQKHVTRQLDPSKMFRVYKYSKQTFWNNSWGVSPWLLKARGIVLDPCGSIVSHPFDKVFNMGENGAGSFLRDDTPVIEVEKLNGFLGICSAHPLKRGELLPHTQGGFDNDFVSYFKEYLMAPAVRGRVSQFLSKTDVTLMFEVLHPDDPHIVETSEEDFGIYLLGIRGKQLEDVNWTEEQVDEAAKTMGLRRPAWRRTTFDKVREFVINSNTEGVMIRLDTPMQETVVKWKTPFYLTTKFLGRLSSSKISHMYGNPENFKKTVDEEFYPIVDMLVSKFTREEFVEMTDEVRVAEVRKLILKMTRNQG